MRKLMAVKINKFTSSKLSLEYVLEIDELKVWGKN